MVDEDIRHAYGAWITPGDVLATLAKSLSGKCPEFHKVMTNFLQKEMLDDHYSKLEQAGHSPDNKVPLEKVFVDLPVFSNRQSNAPDEIVVDGQLPNGFISKLIQYSCQSTIPYSAQTKGIDKDSTKKMLDRELGRLVLIGGPGQGKSTLAQYICQVHRSQLLRHKCKLDPNVSQVCEAIIESCNREGIEVHLARRFPIRIELARFARVLAESSSGKPITLLHYIAQRIRDRTDYDISTTILRNWLEMYPWIVVLDGLDEVPSSSNRDQVLAAAHDFLIDISSCEADVVVIATTRPQGYNEDFSRRRFLHLWLAPLSIPRALYYGNRLVEITYGNDTIRSTEIVDRLREASQITATARLMESPLQVTIMARLLAQISKPPQERYKLFQQYYKVIYRREMERGVEKLSQLLRNFEADIDAIHFRTGLILQIESERSKHTDATLSKAAFERIVTLRLKSEGHPPEICKSMASEIVTCATQRLVFLVPSEDGRVGFEIRSLQEFMAAEALMDGGDIEVTDRLRKISSVPYWQNVFLFSAGKCFAERQWLRHSISALCAEMNNDPEDSIGRAVLSGSQLALALLEDGPARRQPAYSQALARQIHELLVLPPSEFHDRIADVYEPEFKEVYAREIERTLGNRKSTTQLAAWQTLLRLMEKPGCDWCESIAENHWPKTRDSQSTLLQDLDPRDSDWLWNKLMKGFFSSPPSKLLMYPAVGKGLRYKKKERLLDKRKRVALDFEGFNFSNSKSAQHYQVVLDNSVVFSASIITLEVSKKIFRPLFGMTRSHPYWTVLICSAEFARNPNSESLATALETLAERGQIDFGYLKGYLAPWPLAACIHSAKRTSDFRLFAEHARAGNMGDYDDWHTAERRWHDKGVYPDDLQINDERNMPFDSNIGKRGFPRALCFLSANESSWDLISLEKTWENLRNFGLQRYAATRLLELALDDMSEDFDLKNSDKIRSAVLDIIELDESPLTLSYENLLVLFNVFRKSEDCARIMNLFGTRISSLYFSRDNRFSSKADSNLATMDDMVDFLVTSLESDERKVGILKLLFYISGDYKFRKLPANIERFKSSTCPEIRLHAHVVSIHELRDSADGLARLIDFILDEWGSLSSIFYILLGTVQAQTEDESVADIALSHLWGRMKESDLDVRRRGVSALNDALNRRITNLQSTMIWEKLGLPDKLHEVFGLS